MGALSGGGCHGSFWGWRSDEWSRPRNRRQRRDCKSDGVSDSAGSNRSSGYRFPIKQAVTAGSLALTGDTIAQVQARLRRRKESALRSDEDIRHAIFSDHDWLRALRMSSYGFLLYGPGSYLWYQYLDRTLPDPTVPNFLLKVLLNQIVLGPSVIAVVFAWNNLWLGKLSELPRKYQKDALPTLLYGFRFWIPVSALNFWVVPLQARVAFMSMGSIFWNFCLSSTMSK
ncbi:hypothetical protein MLD38_015842 [Melastoma candidum]|uniref:Uncharacterized protein n=1 Tax=Melastoma candidum TaxID=119954 RepID=A0ACB9RKJ0_9MYRT|nr:hypothetical protein MLD38_015842 [Melastoma candidum]